MHSEQQIKGLLLSLLCLLSYSAANVLFKVSSSFNVNPLALISLAMLFTGLALILRGGKTTLAYQAIRSIHTWIYGIASVMEASLVVYIMYFITAAEAAIATRISIVFSLLVAYIFQHRNTLGQGIWGVPAIITGVAMVVWQFDSSDMLTLILILLGISIFRNTYFFSIELNKVGHKADKTKELTQDLSVMGYIISVAALLSFIVLFITAAINTLAGLKLPAIPEFNAFMNPHLFIFAAFYGLTISVITRYTEFKSVQYVKPEVFQCVTAFSPLVTLAFEKCLVLAGVIDGGTELSATLAIANVLVITGSLYVIIRKYMTVEEFDKDVLKAVRQKVRDAAEFYDQDIPTIAAKLGIPKRVAKDILAGGKKPLLRRYVTAIKDNHAITVAATDRITKLSNRAAFEVDVKELENYALIFIDLNKFKPVNDTHGHEADDAVLYAIGQRLDHATDAGFTTRLGGDEFVIALPETSKAEAEAIAQDLQEIIAQPIKVKGIEEELSVGGATGVAHFPEDGATFEAVLKHADKVMYKNKNSR